jgi:hypothetical protein
MVRILVEIVLVLIAVRWGLGALRARMARPHGTALRGNGGEKSGVGAIRVSAELEKGARWETHTESGGGLTAVLIRRVATNGVELGRQTIATIPDAAADWDMRYHEAMAEARNRLAALESESA